MQDLPRRIGFWGGSAIMVGIIIGSGIFRQPAAIAKEMGSPSAILWLWVAGGALALLGALTYAELATMYPRSGGIYVYLNEGLGRPVAFVFGWTYMLITKPFAAAGIATVFAEHVNKLCGVSWDPRILTCVLLVALTVVNVIGTRLGAGVAVVFTALKLGALILIVALGVILMKGSAAHFAASPASKTFMAALAPVMLAILWTYDGWSDVSAIAGEVTEPQRRIPRILLTGTLAVTVIYVAVNAVYISLVPLPEMAVVKGGTVAPVVMERLLGPAGAVIVTIMILVSTAGASHGAVITGARITFAQARDGLLFRFLGRIHPTCETPDVSLWVQCILSCAASLFLGNFSALADGFTFTMWIFYAMAGIAMIVLRLRRPDLERPCRCWGYPVVPALFVASALFVTVLTVWQDGSNPESRGANTLPWIGLLVAGVPVYYLWRKITSTTPAAAPPPPP